MNLTVGICTLNRSNDLDITLKSFLSNTRRPNNIVIVDQSKDNTLTINVIRKYESLLNINYHKVDFMSLTRGKNLIIAYNDNYDDENIICFLDDDVTLDKYYFEAMMNTFSKDNSIDGVSGFFTRRRPLYYYVLYKMIFNPQYSFVQQYVDENMIEHAPLFSFGNREVEWIFGGNGAFRSRVFKEHLFDEQMIRYCMGEDLDFSYRMHCNNKKMVLCPDAKLLHRVSDSSRLPSKAQIVMRLTYQRYLIAKFKDNNSINCLYNNFFKRHLWWNFRHQGLIQEINKEVTPYFLDIDNLELTSINSYIESCINAKC